MLCIGVIVYAGYRNRPQTVVVRTQILSASPVKETVSCKGRVEETTATEVLLPADCVVDEVVVENGQQVKKGDALFTVDKTATLSVLSQTDSVAAVNAAMEDAVIQTVTAPCDGVVTDLTVEKGALLYEEDICAVIAESEPVQIRLSIPERNIARVKVGQTVAVSGIGFLKKQYSGHISEIASVAKQQLNGTATETMVEAVVTLDEGQSDDSLRVGLTAKGAITVSTVPVGYILPYDAVCADEENREFVYILQDETAQKRLFTSVAELSNGYLVIDGFQNGEQLILQPDKVAENSIYRAKETKNA